MFKKQPDELKGQYDSRDKYSDQEYQFQSKKIKFHGLLFIISIILVICAVIEIFALKNGNSFIVECSNILHGTISKTPPKFDAN